MQGEECLLQSLARNSKCYATDAIFSPSLNVSIKLPTNYEVIKNDDLSKMGGKWISNWLMETQSAVFQFLNGFPQFSRFFH